MAGERAGPRLAIGGGLAALALFGLVVLAGGAAWRAWLAAAILLAGVPTGAVALSMMCRLIPGSWRESLAEPLAIAPGLLPLAALAMTPALLAPGLFYGWPSEPAETAFRAAYLSPAFFALRGAAWFAGLAWLALRLRPGREATAVSAVGLVLLVPASLLITTDWLMSLDPHYASSGFGLYVLSIEIGLALALAVAAVAATGLPERAGDVLGGVLLCVVALWAYLGFMQYFIVWSDDLPPSVSWYLRRGGAWGTLAWAAMALKGGPASLLVAGRMRRNPASLRAIALAIAGASVLEVGWLVLPAPGPPAGDLDALLFLAIAAALGAAGLGLAVVARNRRAAP